MQSLLINGTHLAGVIFGFLVIYHFAQSVRYARFMWPFTLVWGAVMASIIFMYTMPWGSFIFWDFVECYWLAGELVWDGPQALAGAYRNDSPEFEGLAIFVNLPIVAYLFAPFGLLSPLVGAIAFSIIGVFVVGYIWRLLVQLYSLEARESAFLFFALCVFGPLLYSFKVGNTSHFILALVLAGMAMDRSGKALTAGALFGVAAVIKPALLLIGVLYFLRGRWSVVAGGAAVLAGSVLLSLLVFGWDMHVLWYETSIQPFADSTVSAYGNQTVQAVIARMEVGAPAGHDYAPYALSTGARLLAQGVALALVLGCVYAAFRSGRLFRATRSDLELELMMVLTLAIVVSVISWVHYFVWLMPALVILWLKTRPQEPLAIMRWPLIGVFGLLVGIAFTSNSMTVGRFGPFSNMIASHWLIGGIILLGMLAAVRAQKRDAPAG